MIQINEYEILRNAICSLKETSKSNHNGNMLYMTESEVTVVNFDDVKDQYVSTLSVPEAPKSNDALFVDKEGELFFVEFKAGNMEKKIYPVRKKLFDSLLILTDIISKGISYTREHLSYILVYDETLNQSQEDEVVYQVTPSREKMNSRYLKKGGREFIRFNLHSFHRLYVKHVFTLSREEFKERFTRKWEAEANC